MTYTKSLVTLISTLVAAVAGLIVTGADLSDPKVWAAFVIAQLPAIAVLASPANKVDVDPPGKHAA